LLDPVDLHGICVDILLGDVGIRRERKTALRLTVNPPRVRDPTMHIATAHSRALDICVDILLSDVGMRRER